uniref:Uncharacterized protein n=1 Tax=Oryza nivara TaxID=4536 RepID=A0A0E0H8J6_ORYNI
MLNSYYIKIIASLLHLHGQHALIPPCRCRCRLQSSVVKDSRCIADVPIPPAHAATDPLTLKRDYPPQAKTTRPAENLHVTRRIWIKMLLLMKVALLPKI